MRAGSGSGRGRHRGRNSPETKRWDTLEGDLERIFLPTDPRKPKPKRAKPKPPAPAPPRPHWITPAVYGRLLELREQL